MLDHILRAFADYEKRHGIAANLLEINYDHYRQLVKEHPELFGQNSTVEWGFRIHLMSSMDLKHPRVRRFGVWSDANVVDHPSYRRQMVC